LLAKFFTNKAKAIPPKKGAGQTVRKYGVEGP